MRGVSLVILSLAFLLTSCAAKVVVQEVPAPMPSPAVAAAGTPDPIPTVEPEGEAPPKGPLETCTLFLATDLHYISPRLTDNGECFTRVIESGDGKFMSHSEELLNGFVDEVIEKQPDALILARDITFNGAKQSHLDLAEKLKKIEAAGVPVYLIPGNHDIGSRQAAFFLGNTARRVESVSSVEFGEIYYSFGFDEALSVDPVSLSYTVQLPPNLRLLLVDANGIPGAAGIVTDRTVGWVEEQLQAARQDGCWVLCVSHQSLLAHNPLLTLGYQMVNWERILALYEACGVIANLSGHLHVQHITVSDAGLADIATSALATSPNQYGVLTLGGTGGEYHTTPVSVPRVKNFAQLSHDFLWANAYRQAARRFEDPNDEALRVFQADVNVRYIAGRGDAIDWENVPTGADGEELFQSAYFQSIRADSGNYTEHVFSFP